MPTISSLQIKLLGYFHVSRDGMPVVVQQAPAQSLLAYLILHCDSRQPRQQLAYLFWPDSTEAQAFANLRRTLHQLRHALPDSERFLASDGRTIQWQPDAPFSCDVALFEEQLAAADQAAVAGKMVDQQAALEAAVDLYTGDLLPSCYDDWILPERERLRERFAESLARLIDLLEQSRAYKSAIRHANRLLHADPLREESYQQVMRLYALVGDRAAALHTYHTCVSTLRRELNVEPDAATQELNARILKAANFLPKREPTAALTRRQDLVGREVEWQYLLASWQAASQGTARVVVIAGEAGIGKTRLAEELYNFVGQQGFLAARTRAYAVTGDLAYAPVTELLCSKALGELWRRLDMVWLTELSRLLPELLIERPQLHRPEPLSESWQRTRLFEALARAVVLVGQPLLLMLDDLQWCDRESLTWLPFLLRFAAHSPLLVVATLRSEEVSGEHALFPLLTELQREGQLAEITLAPLSAAETATMATQWLGFALSPEKAASLYTESEGFPLFIVEMLNTRMERVEVGLASPMQGAAALPAKVQATIQSRLVQLSPLARQLADAAAVVGRALDLTVLATISELTEENFVQGLDELWRRRIIREQGGNAYDFSHDKIREVAYAAMSPVRRRWLHQRVAQAMEQVHSGDLDTVSGQIAEHYTEAALPQVALDYYERAAAVAQRLYAHSDAATYLNKALALLPNLPVTEELLHCKLRIQLTLARSLESRHGMSAAGLMQLYLRGQELAEQVGDDEQQLMVLDGLWRSYMICGQVKQGRDIAEQSLVLAERIGEPSRLAEAHGRLGEIFFHLGHWHASREQMEQALAAVEYSWDASAQLRGEQYPGELIQLRLGFVLWYLGYADQAQFHMRASMIHAQVVKHPHTLAALHFWSGWLHYLGQEAQLAQAEAEASLELAQHYGFLNWAVHSRAVMAWTLSYQGRIEEALVQVNEALLIRQAINLPPRDPEFLALLAEIYGRCGQSGKGLLLLNEALAEIESSGVRFCEPEVYRVQGELLQMQGVSEAEAESSFNHALAVAQRQEAKSLELRVALNLARIWQKQGKRKEAYSLVAKIYYWFTEGFETPLLNAAKVLLADLAS